MTQVRRLVTRVEVDGRVADDAMSLAVRQDAELTDGRRVLLLDGRGWTMSGPPGVWGRTTVAEVEATARAVVGPDEPRAGRSAAEESAAHHEVLAAELVRYGVQIHAAELPRLPHDVELGPGLRERLAG